MDAGFEQNLGAQIVAQPGDEALVQQQRSELAAAEPGLVQPGDERVHRGCLGQHVRTEAAQKRVLALGLGVEDLDL